MHARARDLEERVAPQLAQCAQIRRGVHPELLEQHAERHRAQREAPRGVGHHERGKERRERCDHGRRDDPAECRARRELRASDGLPAADGALLDDLELEATLHAQSGERRVAHADAEERPDAEGARAEHDREQEPARAAHRFGDAARDRVEHDPSAAAALWRNALRFHRQIGKRRKRAHERSVMVSVRVVRKGSFR
jgi:hypothetical protein